MNGGTNVTRTVVSENVATTMTAEREFLLGEGEKEVELINVPELRGSVGTREVDTLFDSGAEICAMSQQLYDELRREGIQFPTFPVPQITIICATKGRGRKVNEQAYLKIKWGENMYGVVCLIVPQLTRELIIGTDFMQEAKVAIDFTQGLIRFGESSLPMLKKPSKWQKGHESPRIELACEEELEDAENILAWVGMPEVRVNHVSERVRHWDTEVEAILGKCQTDDMVERECVRKLVNNYRDVFSEKIGRTNAYQARIPVKDDVPFKQKTYPIPWSCREEVERQVQEMLSQGIIERGNSPYVNPLVCVRKRDGSVRVCVDARSVNEKIIPDRRSPGEPEDLFAAFHETRYISTTDFCKGFWQVPLHPADRKYTAFLYRGKCYQFCVLPFGLSNSVGEFCRAIEESLGPELSTIVHAYVDDLLVVSTNFEEHIETLQRLFGRLRTVGLTLKLGKSLFLRSEVKFLGFVLNAVGISPDPEKIDLIHRFPTPRNVKEVRTFLGICNFYRRFAEQFATVVAPILGLLKKGAPWEWTERCSLSFEAAKKLFTERCVALHPDFTRDFILYADASGYGLGAKLVQVGDEGEEKLIAFSSRSLIAAERAYTVTERECLAVVWSLGKWRSILLGHRVIIRSDHHSLSFLQSCRLMGSRLTRWCLALQEFEFKIEYVSGKENSDADLLSRTIVGTDGIVLEDKPRAGPVIARVVVEKDTELVHKFPGIATAQREDDVWGGVVRTLEDPAADVTDPVTSKLLAWYCTSGGILFRRAGAGVDGWRICIPKVWVDKLVIHVHKANGHFGEKKTLWLLQSSYYWSGMAKRVRKLVSCCELCQKTKFPNRSWEGQWCAILPKNPLELFAIDLYGPLPRSSGGVKYLLVVLDVFSKLVKCYPLKRATAAACVKRLLEDHFPQYGKPKRILSDHGTQFTADEYKWEMLWAGVDVVYSSIRHPQSNPVERCMREIGRLLRAYCHQRHSSWIEAVPLINEFLNTQVHSSTGFAPIELVEDTELREPLAASIQFPPSAQLVKEEKVSVVREKLRVEAERRNKQQAARQTQFSVGDWVLLRVAERSQFVKKETKKLFLLYEGPFVISRARGPNAWELIGATDRVVKGTYNAYSLRPFHKVEEVSVEPQ